MRIGNVIESPGGAIWIVTEIDDRTVQAVSFDAENVSAVQRLDDHERTETCVCGDHPQEDCERCHGTGSYTVRVKGWKRSKVLAPHVQAFIERGIKRMFHGK